MAIKRRKCEHHEVQEWTECCCDCGVNIYSENADDQWIYWDTETGKRIYDIKNHIEDLELQYANELQKKVKNKVKKAKKK